MRVRWIGLTLALVLLGLVAGYALGRASVAAPDQLAIASPMAAVDPSWPAEPATVVPDPTYPALAPGHRTHLETVGIPPFTLTVPVPNGWVRSNPAPGAWRWYPTDEYEQNVYFLRVHLVGNRNQPVPAALAERLSALRYAEDVADLDIQSMTTDAFTATYVSDEHRRVSIERFLASDIDNTTAFAWVALVGREADREGMAELFPRIANGLIQ